MSRGMKPYDFVQQVYYAQEKVLLDFIPSDDKYREVLVEANLVLQELQNVEDWTWLREKLILGPCDMGLGVIPEWKLPDWVYKVSTLNHDGVKLMKPVKMLRARMDSPRFLPYGEMWLDQKMYIDVPFASMGDNQHREETMVTGYGAVHWPDMSLRAIKVGNYITLNREPIGFERECIATVDVQRKIPLLHVCDHTCKAADGSVAFNYTTDENHDYIKPCTKIEEDILTSIPDPNYVVMATAARHAEGSPPALARVAGLQDASQKILSAMRSNDASATDADYQDWQVPGYVSVF